MYDKDAVEIHVLLEKKKGANKNPQHKCVSVFPHYAIVFYFPLLFSIWKYSYYGDSDDIL